MRPLVIAHRGASGEAPENTIAAFELARAQRADMVELDVQRTADDVLVVFHDDTTERWNGREAIGELTWSALKELRIGGEPVATFDELCAWAAWTRIPLNVELKVPGIEPPVVAMMRDYKLVEQVIVSSFHPAALAAMREVAPEYALAVLHGQRWGRPEVLLRGAWPLLALRRIEAAAWHPASKLPMLRRLVPLVRRRGYRVNVWTVDDPGEMRALIKLGVDGIITNYPARLRTLLDRGLAP